MGRKKVNHYFVSQHKKQYERIQQMLTLLDLTAVASSFEKLAELGRKKHSTLEDFLESILEQEMIAKEENRITRWTQQAHFPFKKTIEEFDFSFQPSVDQVIINSLLTCRFVEEGKNVLFFGPAGVGKTHLSVGLGIAAIDKGFEARFLKLDELIDLFKKTQGEHRIRLLRILVRPKLLILDDIDFYNMDKDTSDFFSKLIFNRHKDKAATMFTSNRNFNEWAELFGNKQRAESGLDRILERAEIIKITGDSYRIKDKINKIKSILIVKPKEKILSHT